jgi:hypothetical protein
MSLSDKTLVMTSVRLDKALHATLRRIAFERRVSLHSLLIEGTRLARDKYQQTVDGPQTDSVLENGTHAALENGTHAAGLACNGSAKPPS